MTERIYIKPDSVVLDKEEAEGLARVLRHCVLPRSLDGALRKLGVNPEGYSK